MIIDPLHPEPRLATLMARSVLLRAQEDGDIVTGVLQILVGRLGDGGHQRLAGHAFLACMGENVKGDGVGAALPKTIPRVAGERAVEPRSRLGSLRLGLGGLGAPRNALGRLGGFLGRFFGRFGRLAVL